MARFVVSAAHKSSGKTTVTIGLCAALAARGLKVQPFKKGPDYIDPMWLSQAAGRTCRNLDFYTQPPADMRETFARHAADADVNIVEGNKGFYDGVDLEGADCTAALAKLLDAPAVLVIDTGGMTRGIAPLLRGYQTFDPAVRIAGVILNKVSGPRHERKLRQVVEHYTDIPILGAIPRSPALEIVERHIGLVPTNEAAQAATVIDAIAQAIAGHVDLDAVLGIASAAPPFGVAAPPRAAPLPAPDLRIGIARDAAFGFYYPDDLEALAQAGAALVDVDMLRDERLPPDLDGLFIGGGFPEAHMQALEANRTMRASVRAAVEGGLPVYAECGGLMYLSQAIVWNGERREMVAALPGETVMHRRPKGRGYVRLRETDAFPWPHVERGPGVMTGHEFHHSSLEKLPGGLSFGYEVLRGMGVDGHHDGIVYRNTVASYAHLRSVGADPWAARFAAFARQVRRGLRRAV
ncbi:MAG: cobyrinate a,c-diamide synthase [Rhodospirillales bacterium]|nr:cobyrinate a,c-diamide synthase [Rhodospirillales bacterium]